MKRIVFVAAVLVAITGLGAGAYYARRGDEAPEIVTAAVSRGTIVSSISASGTLEAVTTVQVGTQISGTVQALYADFNSVVKKGQVIARLDQSLVRAEIDQARASLVRAEAEVDRLQVALTDAETKARRAQELADRELIPRADLDAADVALRSTEAQVRSARAQVTQARAALAQEEVNLEKTVITAPIDGMVIARNVDVGQTVAASLQAPTLFAIAADLGQMQVKANIDESDLGQVREGQTVTFTVDAYPNDVFTGTLKQVRLNPVVEQNVVTYAAIISAPNPQLKLRPGMTANVTVETARRENVLRVPATALRFKPDEALLTALGPGKSAVDANHEGRRDVHIVWRFDGRLQATPVQVGATDGTLTEITGGNLEEGSRVVTRVASSAAAAPASRTSGNPLLATPGRRF